MTKGKIGLSLLGLVLVLAAAAGGFYYYASNQAEKVIPGHVYSYASQVNKESESRELYVAFSATSDRAVVTPDRDRALKANASQADFDQIYQEDSKSSAWRYKVSGNKLTLGKVEQDQLSQWQYNSLLAYGQKVTSRSFTYQIANAGQGQVKDKVVFQRLS